MSRPRGSSGSWRSRQERDPFVQQARKEGWRSRAVFKLDEILAKEKLLKPAMSCVDLGAAPGGWSQLISALLKGRGRILAVDLLAMDSLPDVDFLQGDFTEQEILHEIIAWLDGRTADLVMSDLSPNISGTKAVDQPRSMYLSELALELAREVLKAGGSFVCKIFQGEGSDAFIADARRSFKRVKVMKPAASRAASSEVYLVARNYQL